MEELKRFDEIHERDSRQHDFVILTEGPTRYRKISLRDIYNYAENIELHAGVPEKVRSHFEMARHLLIYSWFHYPFHMAAWLYALISVEYALREKIGRKNIKFKDMLKLAVKEKWIVAENLSHVQARIQQLKDPPDEYFAAVDEDSFKEYCDSLAESIPEFRNLLAHGSTMLTDASLLVKICAELICQLFPEPEKHGAG